jgi:hypothetical protein
MKGGIDGIAADIFGQGLGGYKASDAPPQGAFKAEGHKNATSCLKDRGLQRRLDGPQIVTVLRVFELFGNGGAGQPYEALPLFRREGCRWRIIASHAVSSRVVYGVLIL